MSLLAKPKLLIWDEMGYLTLDSAAATCLFQLVSERHERAPSSWPQQELRRLGAIFADNVVASAVLHRLLYRSPTISLAEANY